MVTVVPGGILVLAPHRRHLEQMRCLQHAVLGWGRHLAKPVRSSAWRSEPKAVPRTKHPRCLAGKHRFGSPNDREGG